LQKYTFFILEQIFFANHFQDINLLNTFDFPKRRSICKDIYLPK